MNKEKEKKGARVYGPTKELLHQMLSPTPGKKSAPAKVKKSAKPKAKK